MTNDVLGNWRLPAELWEKKNDACAAIEKQSRFALRARRANINRHLPPDAGAEGEMPTLRATLSAASPVALAPRSTPLAAALAPRSMPLAAALAPRSTACSTLTTTPGSLFALEAAEAPACAWPLPNSSNVSANVTLCSMNAMIVPLPGPGVSKSLLAPRKKKSHQFAAEQTLEDRQRGLRGIEHRRD